MGEAAAHHGILEDIDLHVDDHGGPGRPVVLLHGWPLSGEAFADQVPALRQAGYRPITYDRRGSGRSDDASGRGCACGTLTRDLARVLEVLDLQDATLVGCSMGGGEVVRLFTDHDTTRVRSVVLVAATPPFLLRAPGNPDGPLSPKRAASMAAGLTTNPDAFYEDVVDDLFCVDGRLQVDEARRRQALRLAGQAGGPAALAAMLASASTDFRADLPNVRVPVLVLHGDGDAVVPFEGSGRRIHEALPGSALHVIHGAPHACNVSHAGAFNRVLLDFLAT